MGMPRPQGTTSVRAARGVYVAFRVAHTGSITRNTEMLPCQSMCWARTGQFVLVVTAVGLGMLATRLASSPVLTTMVWTTLSRVCVEYLLIRFIGALAYVCAPSLQGHAARDMPWIDVLTPWLATGMHTWRQRRTRGGQPTRWATMPPRCLVTRERANTRAHGCSQTTRT